MITFASLFLGLVLGTQTLELVVSGEVAAVELRLDGATAVVLREPPWTVELDFGDSLLPRRLEAVALDSAGDQIARAQQWLNLPQDPAVTRWTLDSDRRIARLTWESYAGAQPADLRITFDGLPLSVDDPRRIELPTHDLAQLHFLRAELDFEDNVTSVAEMTFGGTYADRVSTELTAVPVVAGRKPPDLESLRPLFSTGGEPLRVVAIDRGIAEIVMIVDRAFPTAMADIWRREARRRRLSRIPAGPLKRDQRLRFIYPVAEPKRGSRHEFELFPRGPEYTARDGNVFALLMVLRPLDGTQRLADGVAVAGLAAAGPRRRRVAVLVLGPEPAESSGLEIRQVRSYLEALHVPLVVWYPGRELPEGFADWGEAVDISTFFKLDSAFSDLKRRLERQWIVWLDGTHLPQKVELRDGTESLRIAR